MSISVTQVATDGRPGLELLPGEFAIETFLKETFITAVDGGGRIANAVHTDATKAQAWEKFKLWVDRGYLFKTPENPEGFVGYAFQTPSGNYLTAVDGGGRTTDVLHTDAKQVLAWEHFGLIPQFPPASASIYPPDFVVGTDSPWYYALATNRGSYLSALGGGGKIADPAMHSDAQQVGSWELFRLIKSGELISGCSYALRAVWPDQTRYVIALEGGGKKVAGLAMFGSTFGFEPLRRTWAQFKLLRQADGSYALQTNTGNYVTAARGGGVGLYSDPEDGAMSDVFHTDAEEIQSWEKFKFLDQGDCTYAIQLDSGYFVGLGTGEASWLFRTDITAIEDAAKFRLSPLFSEM